MHSINNSKCKNPLEANLHLHIDVTHTTQHTINSFRNWYHYKDGGHCVTQRSEKRIIMKKWSSAPNAKWSGAENAWNNDKTRPQPEGARRRKLGSLFPLHRSLVKWDISLYRSISLYPSFSKLRQIPRTHNSSFSPRAWQHGRRGDRLRTMKFLFRAYISRLHQR